MRDQRSWGDSSRREFLGVGLGAAAAAVTTFGAFPSVASAANRGRHPRPVRQLLFPESLNTLTLPALPYVDTDLAPVISANTLGFHYGKHTKAYYTNLATAITGTTFATMSLEAIIRSTANDPNNVSIFNNASQAMNHSFYFAGLRGGGGGTPPSDILADLQTAFGGLAEFKTALVAASTGRFGSGWAWLVLNYSGALEIVSTANADSPVSTRQGIPLLTIDVWEHAYYLDYQNLRAGYAGAVIDKLINWDFVAANLERARSILQR